MNYLVCPTCGANNPFDAELCVKCSLLLNIGSDAKNEGGKNSPDWLNRIRERSQLENPDKPLGDFGEAEHRPFDAPASPEEVPDWLKELQGVIPPNSEEKEKSEVDWTARLHEFKNGTNQSKSQSTTFFSQEELDAMEAAAKRAASEPGLSDPEVPDKSEELNISPGDIGVENDVPVIGGDSQTTPPDSHETKAVSIDQPVESEEPLDAGGLIPEPSEEPIAENIPEPILVDSVEEDKVSGIETPMDVPVPPDKSSESSSLSNKQNNEKLEVQSKDDELEGETLILQSVLQPQYSRSVEYSGRLAVSEAQREKIELLKSMLVGEIKPAYGSGEREIFGGRYLRALIGVLLLVMMAYPFVTSFTLFKQQALFSPGVIAMHNAINKLPVDAPILVVADYEPAFSGEMKSAAAGVIDNLMMKEMDFTFISTVPSGTALIRDLIGSIRLANFAYQEEKIAVLGYIPGGTTGLQDFIRNPRQAAPLLDNGNYAWTYPAAKDVNSIQDYSGILVITENAETGRAWIEQLQGVIKEKPLLMVVSVQNAPILRPYLDSGQLKGLVSGRVEGAMYDRLMDAPPRIVYEMTSYQLGVLLAAGLILLGGLFGILNGLIKPKINANLEDWHDGR